MLMIFIKIILRKFLNLMFKIIFYNIFLVMEIITNKFYISNYYNIIIKLLIYYQIIIIKLHMISIAKNPFIIL